ncbi:sulfotransferase family 2 domain-containing protein [Vibrio breoganii]
MTFTTMIKKAIKSYICRLIFRIQGVYNPYSPHEDKYKFIYVHIPKTAGNGLLGSLFGCKGTGHNILDEYIRYDREKFNKYYKFTVVRNPYNRFVSAFNYLKSGGANKHDRKVMKPLLSSYDDVNSFIEALKNDELLCMQVLNYVHFIPQKNFLYTQEYRWNHSIDHIGKQEELEKTFNHLSDIFGIQNKKLKISNATPFYDSNLTLESKEFIYSYYEEDFKLLGYEK